jgi:drug/metabolite transporter (DMT)-like permease
MEDQMDISRAGELLALATAVAWTASAFLFGMVSKRAGSFTVNLLKVTLALIFMNIYFFIRGDAVFPAGVSVEGWLWLASSGVTGFILGDIFLFQAFILIGARVTMVVFAFAPSLTAIMGYMFLGEIPGVPAAVGMAVTLAGIIMVVLSRPANGGEIPEPRLKGVIFAFIATICQAAGYLLSKQGMHFTDPARATQIRLAASVIGFALLLIVLRKTGYLLAALKDSFVMTRITAASFFGPFSGVTLSMYAINSANTGIAAAIMSMTPVFLIVPSVLILKERVTLPEIAGAVLAVSGSAVMFIV